MTTDSSSAQKTDAVVDTGAALASAGAFGLFGALLGKKIGSLGSSGRHDLSGTIGGWIGGMTFAVLSLYASLRSREQHEHVMGNLREENERLREELDAKLPVITPTRIDMPGAKVTATVPVGVTAELAPEKNL